MEQIDLSAAQIKSRDQEIERLKGELREATESLEVTMAEEQVPLTFPFLHLFSQLELLGSIQIFPKEQVTPNIMEHKKKNTIFWHIFEYPFTLFDLFCS